MDRIVYALADVVIGCGKANMHFRSTVDEPEVREGASCNELVSLTGLARLQTLEACPSFYLAFLSSTQSLHM